MGYHLSIFQRLQLPGYLSIYFSGPYPPSLNLQPAREARREIFLGCILSFYRKLAEIEGVSGATAEISGRGAPPKILSGCPNAPPKSRNQMTPLGEGPTHSDYLPSPHPYPLPPQFLVDLDAASDLRCPTYFYVILT